MLQHDIHLFHYGGTLVQTSKSIFQIFGDLSLHEDSSSSLQELQVKAEREPPQARS